MSKLANISYRDSGFLHPSERKMLLGFLIDDKKQKDEEYERLKQSRKRK